MPDASIGTLQASYRLPPSRAHERHRLDRLLREAAGDPLDLAIDLARERAGVRPNELICIRRVQVPVRLRLSAGDRDLTDAWNLQLADAIERQIRAGDPRNLVRYADLLHALVDLALAAVRGSSQRAWAWSGLGLSSAGEQAGARALIADLVQALAIRPPMLIPLLRQLAEGCRLGGLLSRLGRDLEPLTERLLERLDLPPVREILSGEPLAGPPSSPPGVLEQALRENMSRLEHLGVPSWILATLAALDADPGCAAEPLRARRRISASWRWLFPEAERRAAGARWFEPGGRSDPAWPSALPEQEQAHTAALDGPEPAARGQAPSEQEPGAESFDAAATTEPNRPADGSIDETGSRRDAKSSAPSAPESREGDRGTREDSGSVDPTLEDRQPTPPEPVISEHIGLLFLIPVLDELDLPARMAAAEALGLRPLSLALHLLGRLLSGCAPDDPALDLFAGLVPGTERPWAAEDEPANWADPVGWAELARPNADARQEPTAALGFVPQPNLRDTPAPLAESLAAWAGEVLTALQQRMDPDAGNAHALLQSVIRRRGLIRAEPGWVEIELAADSVDLAVRRAGLDLDPGWVPWLGMVMRYAYL